MCIALLLLAAILCAPIGASAPAPTFQIVFESDRDGDADLWLVESDGTRERALTKTVTPEGAPSWSPDGTTVVYACAPARNWELCTIDVATGRVMQLTHTAADEFDPRYTADGSEIVLETYPEHRRADIAIMPATGGVPRRLTKTPEVDDQDPAPDPNSTRIAFESGANIVVMDTRDPREVTRVTSGSRGYSDPSFSSKDEIAFAGGRTGTPDIFVAGPEGTSGRRPLRKLASGVSRDVEPAWTAAGTELVFARSASARRGFRIFRVRADGGRPQAVTKGGAYDDAAPAPRPVAGATRLARTLRLDVRAAQAPFCQSTWQGSNAGDTKHGTSVRNCMYGNGGGDRVHGEGGRDKVRGDGGKDRLYGGSGNDRLYADDGEKDIRIDGGTGDADWARIDPGEGNITFLVETVVS